MPFESSGLPQIGVLASGEVVVDRFNSHLHASVRPFLREALARVEAGGRVFLTEEVDFGRPLGETICIPTAAGDAVVFARRPGRQGLTRFVKNRAPLPSSSVVVVLKRGDNGVMVLVTAFIGQKPEPEPWDRNATERSREFWSHHALVWGVEETVAGTETTLCPW